MESRDWGFGMTGPSSVESWDSVLRFSAIAFPALAPDRSSATATPALAELCFSESQIPNSESP